MLNIDFWQIWSDLNLNLIKNIENYIHDYWENFFWSIIILIFWAISSIIIYNFVIFLFKKFKIVELLEKFEIDIYEEHEKVLEDQEKGKLNKNDKQKKDFENLKKEAVVFKKKIKVDSIVAKAISYYVFLLFFRWSVVKLGVTEVEQFLKDVLYYLPSLFVWILIWYFWIRFANFIYDVTYHTLNLAKQEAAKIIAYWAKIIILFFTLMFVLNYTKIVDGFIINTILVWFISMLTIAWWLAFWLGWKDIAREILESLRK